MGNEITVGGIKVGLGLDTSDWEVSLTKMAGGLTALGASVAAGVAAATVHFAALTDHLAELADQLGSGTSKLQEWRYAAAQNGGDVDKVADSVSRMQKALSQGSDAFQRLGLDAGALKQAGTEEAVSQVATAIAGIKDPADRAAAAMELFGKSGSSLIPTLKNLQSASEDFRAKGFGIPPEAVAAGAALQDQLDTLAFAFEAVGNQIGGVVAQGGAVQAFIEGLTNLLGDLAQAIQSNQADLQQWVSAGIVFAAEALSQAVSLGVSVLQLAAVAWKGISDVWILTKANAEQLAAALTFLGKTAASPGNAGTYWKELEQSVKQATAEADKALAENQKSLDTFVGVGERVRESFARFSDSVAASAGKHREAAAAAGDHGRGVAFVGQAAAKATEELQKLSQELGKKLADAQAQGLGGLAGANAKLAADLGAEWQKIADLIAKGAAPAEVDQAIAKFNSLSEALRRAALEAQGLQVLGRTVADVAKELENADAVAAATGGRIQQLTNQDLTALVLKLQELRAQNTAGDPAGLGAMNAALEELARRGVDVASIISGPWDAAFAEVNRQAFLQVQLLAQTGGLAGAIAQGFLLANQNIGGSSGVVKNTQTWEQSLTNIAHQLQAMGSAGGLIGSILAGVSSIGTAFENLAKNGVKGLGDLFKGGISNSLKNLSGALSAGLAAFDIGKALFGALKGLFGGKTDAEKAMEDVGRRWGVSISKGLSEQIAKDAKRLGSQSLGELANLGKVISEAGGVGAFGISKATVAMGQLTAAVKAGQISATEAGKVFDESFGELAAASISKTTGLASAAFVTLATQAKAAGVESKALSEYFSTQLQAEIGGLRAYVDTVGVQTQAGATAIAASVLTEFGALRAAGVSAKDAFSQLGIDKLKQQLDEAGLSGGAAFDALAAQAAQAADEFAGPLLSGIDAITQAAVAMQNQGTLTQATFSGLTAEIGATYQKLIDGGADANTALANLQPDLQRIWELEQRTGYQADATTQALVDQAVEAGAVGEAHKSASEQMLDASLRVADAVEYLAKQLGYIPKAAQDAADGLSDAFNGVQIHPVTIPISYGDGGEGAPHPAAAVPSFSDGGVGDFGSGTLAMLHGREAIIPLDKPGQSSGGAGALASVTNQFAPVFQGGSAREQLRQFIGWLQTNEDGIVTEIEQALA